jgi:hypothetical protein
MGVSENPQRAEGFEDKVENLQFMKEHVPHRFQDTVDQIRDIAEGYDPDGIKDQYYPGWEKADFEELLMEVGEKL